MRRAFSLMELVIVVVILGILTAIAIPRASDLSERTAFRATWYQYQTFARAFDTYHATYFSWPPDAGNGIVPREMIDAGLMGQRDMKEPPPIGGHWDWTCYWSGRGPIVSISRLGQPVAATRAKWDRFDALVDDGNRDAGALIAHGQWLSHPLNPGGIDAPPN